MSQSLAQIYVHVVFSTKDRNPFLKNKSLRDELHRFLVGACKSLDCPALQVGGVEDHVHILCRHGRELSPAKLVRELKRVSSVWIKTKSADLNRFHWQSGYGMFSISPIHVKAISEYIRNQTEHHRKVTFQDEFRRLLRKYGLEWDENYLWQ